jgi:hypothetical protein
MNGSLRILAILFGVTLVNIGAAHAQAQYPLMEKLAERVIQKYQTSSCAALASKRSEPPAPQEQRVLRLLREDPAMRTAFIDRVAAPIANKLFECGMLP